MKLVWVLYAVSIVYKVRFKIGFPNLRHDCFPAAVVDVAHEVVQVVDGVEADAGLRLECPQRLRQVVLLPVKGNNENSCFFKNVQESADKIPGTILLCSRTIHTAVASAVLARECLLGGGGGGGTDCGRHGQQ